MAYTFAVSERRARGPFKVSGKGDRVDITWQTEFNVIVGTDASDDIAAVNPYDVVSATGLPVVNVSIYYFNNEVIPFVICREKTARQDGDASAKWVVTASYKSFTGNQTEAQNTPVAPPVALSSLGTSEEPSLGEMEKVIYEDKASTPKKILLPSGAFFAEPVLERVPILTVKLTQYESSITYQQMLDRKFTVNDDTYRTKAAGTWLIEHVEASEVSVQLSGGATSAALVTYTLIYNPTSEGWKKALALVDNKILSGGVFKPYLDDSDPPMQALVFVDSTGAKKGTQTVPDYVEFQVYDDTDFSAFLQA